MFICALACFTLGLAEELLGDNEGIEDTSYFGIRNDDRLDNFIFVRTVV